MINRTTGRRITASIALLLVVISVANAAETADSIRKRLASASSSIKDIQAVMRVKQSSKSEAKEIGKGVIEFLDQGFKEAKIYYKTPDKFRAEGKAKGIDVVYVLNGNKKQIVAPALMLKKTSDISGDNAKKQSSLDVGFACDDLWAINRVKLLSVDKGVAKLQLVPKGTDDKRKELVWLECKSLKVTKRERYGGNGNLKSRQVYCNHKMIGKMPVASQVKVYSPDGGQAGTIEYKELKSNVGLKDSLFAIK